MADAPIAKHENIYISNGTYTDGEPKVKYRGIFINDEWLILIRYGLSEFLA